MINVCSLMSPSHRPTLVSPLTDSFLSQDLFDSISLSNPTQIQFLNIRGHSVPVMAYDRITGKSKSWKPEDAIGHDPMNTMRNKSKVVVVVVANAVSDHLFSLSDKNKNKMSRSVPGSQVSRRAELVSQAANIALAFAESSSEER